MANVIFNFNGEKITIQSGTKEKMKDICNRFASKIGIETKSLFYLKDGTQLNLDLTYEELENSIDKNSNQMNILVYDSNTTICEDNPKDKVKEILCPTCYENCRISIKDYKIKLFGCENNHEINNILLEEFNDIQKKSELKNKCSCCNNYLFKCITCNKNLCSICKLIHNKEHKIINYNKKDYICNIHNDAIISYCTECKINICKQCETNHDSHKKVKFQDITPNKNSADKLKVQIEQFKKKIDRLSAKINEITKIFNKVIENLEIYYKINYDLLKNYEAQSKNYYILQNINDIQNNIDIKEIESILNDNNFNNQFQNIINIYSKMNNINYNIFNDNEEEKNEEFIMHYKIDKDKPKIRIIGHDFLSKNKEKLSFICENKSYEIQEFMLLSNLSKQKDTLEIKLKGVNNIQDWSYMFQDCNMLLSLKEKINMDNIDITDIRYMFSDCTSLKELDVHWNTKNVTNMSYMFNECRSLITLPDISKWNTQNVTDMSYMFASCFSLTTLPDISNWNTQKVKNMSYMFDHCSSLNTLPDISKWNIQNVDKMSYMCAYCSSLTTLPDISNWNIKGVRFMGWMFYECRSLLSLPDFSKWDTTYKTTTDMFYGCICNK